MEWIDWRNVNPAEIVDVPYAPRPTGNQGTRSTKNILNIICAWDIETSTLPGTEQAFCYQWQMQCGPDRPTIRGREMWEFRACLDRFADAIPKGDTMLLFVHNLSFEFCFLRSVFTDLRPEDVFALDKRKVAKVRLYGGKIELRCSYIMTNMSLGQFTEKMQVEHQKLSGDDFDYSKVRYPWDELTPEELMYCRNDVLGLVEAISVFMSVYRLTLHNIVLTSTGLVRRDVKRVMTNWSYHGLQAVQPNPDIYVALREAFAGGDVHCNRYFAGMILKGVKSMDKSSAYPDADVNYPFPMGKLKRSARKTLRWIKTRIMRDKALLIRMRWTNLRLRDEFDPAPYISFSKVRGVKSKECRLDNGRILEAPRAEMTFTDLDWKIIEAQYTWDSVEVLDLWETRYGYLPDMLRALIISYYEDKTKLKGVDGQEVFYTKAKNLLNSIYGLQAQDPCKDSIVFDEEYTDESSNPELFRTEEGDIPALLEKAAQRPYGSYQWGVWTTARARYELRKMITACGDNFVYCDTDSVKYIGETPAELETYNREKIKQSTANGACATDPSGEVHYMGVFEDDGYYDRFVTLGAKKYAYEDKKGLHITVAGVGKKKGAIELQAAGGLEAFKPAVWERDERGRIKKDKDGKRILKEGIVFRAAGGTEAIYNDRVNMELDIDGHKLVIGPNLCVKPSTYTLGVADDYERLLQQTDVVRDIIHNRNIKKALLAAGKNNRI